MIWLRKVYFKLANYVMRRNTICADHQLLVILWKLTIL